MGRNWKHGIKQMFAPLRHPENDETHDELEKYFVTPGKGRTNPKKSNMNRVGSRGEEIHHP